MIATIQNQIVPIALFFFSSRRRHTRCSRDRSSDVCSSDLFPAVMGAGRFARIGIPAAEVMGPFVGVAEIACGALLMLGLRTRLAAVPLLVDITVAILSTKLPILLGHGYGPFALPQLNRYGFWSMASEARTDYAMLMGLLFLLIVGDGPWSLDAR